MRYLIAVHAAPFAPSGGAASALRFCAAVYANEASAHVISQVFFYGVGVHNLNFSIQSSEKLYLLPQRWQEFSRKTQVPLKACIEALSTYGVAEANAYAAGLGEFFAESLSVDRVLIFK